MRFGLRLQIQSAIQSAIRDPQFDRYLIADGASSISSNAF